jgi:WD40 repeat protein
MTPGAMYDIKQLGCIKLDHRIKFIRTNMEEVRHDPSEQLIHDHYVVTVNEFGKIETYFPNSYEAYRWNLDLKRIFAWQQTKIIDCSTIRSDMMATVNAENANSGLVVVIWDTSTANVLDFIDKIQDVRQVRWCPPHKFRESTLLIASNELITAYDCEAKNFLWIIMEPNLKLYTNLFVIIAYGSKKGRLLVKVAHFACLAYVINYRDGSAIKRMEFTRNQDQVVATGSASNIRLSGLDSKVSAIVLVFHYSLFITGS